MQNAYAGLVASFGREYFDEVVSGGSLGGCVLTPNLSLFNPFHFAQCSKLFSGSVLLPLK